MVSWTMLFPAHVKILHFDSRGVWPNIPCCPDSESLGASGFFSVQAIAWQTDLESKI